MQLLASLATDVQDIYEVSFGPITSHGASINKRYYVMVLVSGCMQEWFLLTQGCHGYLPVRPKFSQVPYQPFSCQFPSSSIGSEFKYHCGHLI